MLSRSRDSALPNDASARFSIDTLRRDALAGTITGVMAIPLTVGICMMSEYPVQTGIATVAVACVVSFICYQFRPGNHVGIPGIAAGLAPVLALGVHHFGMDNMPWLVFLTAAFQFIIWRNRWEGYLLKAVPPFLIVASTVVPSDPRMLVSALEVSRILIPSWLVSVTLPLPVTLSMVPVPVMLTPAP